MKTPASGETVLIFPTALGWMALRVNENAARRLSFGFSSESAARKTIGDQPIVSGKLVPWQQKLVDLLQSYAEGACVDFAGVPLDLDHCSEFRLRVLKICRKIPYGRTTTYGQLAARVGAPGAARAVGTCMAQNPLPLIIPCHRVTRAGGVVGSYSGADGTRTKRLLLAMEAADAAPLRAQLTAAF